MSHVMDMLYMRYPGYPPLSKYVGYEISKVFPSQEPGPLLPVHRLAVSPVLAVAAAGLSMS